MTKTKRIPIINDKFDLSVLLHILSKSWWICLLLPIIMGVLAFLYLRYTQPVYTASCIIQINEENRTSDMLNVSTSFNRTDLPKTIELMRSKEFLTEALAGLPLNISYFNEGTFLSFEMYPEAPFKIEMSVQGGDLYNKPFYVDFVDTASAKITFKQKNAPESQTISLGEWEQVGNSVLRCIATRPDEIMRHRADRPNERYYVIINNPEQIFPSHNRNLQISLLSSAAQTIKITYTGTCANKTSSIVNTIAEEYLKYDVKSKREGSANILAFIDEQLKSIYYSLDETEKQIQSFKKENKIKSKDDPAYTASSSKIEELEKKISELDYELLALDQAKVRLKTDGEINTYEIQASMVGTKTATSMGNILPNLQRIIDERRTLLNNLTPDNIKVKQVESQL